MSVTVDSFVAAVEDAALKNLAPCPFCTSTNLFMNDVDDLAWVNCQECSAEGPLEDTPANAAQRWNSRP